jgi:rare lipoprotein A
MLLSVYRVRVVNGKVAWRRPLHRRVLWPAVAARRLLGRTAGTGHTQTGEASWYDAPGTGFTAASPSLPFGTEVTVTDLDTGESIVVVINDRGPFGGRIIDLSSEAFAALEPLSQGVMQVRLSW